MSKVAKGSESLCDWLGSYRTSIASYRRGELWAQVRRNEMGNFKVGGKYVLYRAIESIYYDEQNKNLSACPVELRVIRAYF